MINDDFLAECRNLDPSATIDREKNRKLIKTRIDEENVVMFTNKRIRRPAIVAAVLIGILSASVAAYAAAPVIWRYFNTEVIQGEEFVNDFWVAEIDLSDGTTSIGSSINIDREALEAAGGGAVVVEVDGEEWIVLDELRLYNIEDGLALLQLENPQLPSFLPEGFAFDRFVFPVDPSIHQYQMAAIPASKHAVVYYSDGENTIRLQMLYLGIETGLGVPEGQEALYINGNKAIIAAGSLTNAETLNIKGVELYDSSTDRGVFTTASIYISAAPDTPITETMLMLMIDGVGYNIRGENVSIYDLVRMAASMK